MKSALQLAVEKYEESQARFWDSVGGSADDIEQAARQSKEDGKVLRGFAGMTDVVKSRRLTGREDMTALVVRYY